MQPSSDDVSPYSHHPVRYARRVVATAFGVTAESRAATVGAMLSASLAESVGYWFQLVLSMAISTLGLVLGSTGVVIAAMLIAPLMGPIVQIGMALAIGSPVLAIRAFTRAMLSVGVVIFCAALITLILPFYEVTPEIAARTSPTALDLIIAGCCALAGAFATVRPGSETTGTAAGTAIGIALVPPLCVIGFGLGSGQMAIAAGASLLFTANLCAILVFAVLMFLALGFDQVNVAELESASLSTATGDRLTLVLAGRLKGLIGSRYSTVLRVLMPLALMVGVYVPLRQALEEVTWQVRVRSAIQKILEGSPVTRDAVRSVINVEKNAVAVRLVVVADGTEAARLKEELLTRIAAAAGVVPSLELISVPDFATLQALASSWSHTVRPDMPSPVDLVRLRQKLSEGLRESWPQAAAGALLSWKIDLSTKGTPTVETLHLGAPLGAAGVSLLSQVLSVQLGSSVEVVDLPLPAEARILASDEAEVWVAALTAIVEIARTNQTVFLQVQMPAEAESEPLQVSGRSGRIEPRTPVAAGRDPVRARLERIVRAELSRLPEAQVCVGVGPKWSVRPMLEPCAQPVSPESEKPMPADGVDKKLDSTLGTESVPAHQKRSESNPQTGQTSGPAATPK